MSEPDHEPTPPRPAAPRRWRSRAGRIGRWAALVVAAGSAAFAVWLCVLVYTTPDVDELRRAQSLQPSVIMSADGEVIGRFAAAYQAPIALREVSPDLINALIATEDHRFYEHHGIDPRRILASLWATLHGDMQGGSTLTQQLARNLFPQQIGNDRNLSRKLREAITALRLERSSTKDEILRSYLNSAPFLYNVRGIEMAARTYFDKPASKLSTAEAATLVGMLKGTERYNPVRNPERARDRRNLVLAQMVRQGMLKPARYERLRHEPLVLSFRRPEDGDIGQARHFVAHIREQLSDWADAHDVDLDADGLVITTTLDAKLQRLAQDAVTQQVELLQRVADDEWSQKRARTARLRVAAATPETPAKAGASQQPDPFAYFWHEHAALLAEMARDTPQFREARKAGRSDAQALAEVLADDATMAKLRDAKTRLSAGFIAIDPASGAVKAWVGSPNFAREQFDHVAQAKRQPGSTFKPFVYGAALQRGLSSEHAYLDAAVDIPLADGGVWHPTDAGGPSGEPMTLRQGLAQSRNTITAQVMQDVGAEAVVLFAQAAGVRDSTLDPVPSLALGTSPVTLVEMADAYATLAALGEHREPLLISRITDRHGRVLESFESPPERVLDRGLIARLVDLMRGVIQEGTGTAVRTEWKLRGDLAGKTGTTQDNTDGWFLLMSPKLVTGAWVGFNDPRVTMRSNYWGQGGHNALRLVGAFMQQAQKHGLVDTRATFPQVPRDAPEAPPEVLLDASAGTPVEQRADAQAARAGPSAVGSRLARWLGLDRAPPPGRMSAAEAADPQRREDAMRR